MSNSSTRLARVNTRSKIDRSTVHVHLSFKNILQGANLSRTIPQRVDYPGRCLHQTTNKTTSWPTLALAQRSTKTRRQNQPTPTMKNIPSFSVCQNTNRHQPNIPSHPCRSNHDRLHPPPPPEPPRDVRPCVFRGINSTGTSRPTYSHHP